MAKKKETVDIDPIALLESIKLELMERWEEAPKVRLSNAIVKIDLTIRELKMLES